MVGSSWGGVGGVYEGEIMIVVMVARGSSFVRVCTRVVVPGALYRWDFEYL